MSMAIRDGLMRLNAKDALSAGWLVFRESIRSFLANDSLQSAATLAYYGFLSLMPLLLLVIYLLGFFMQSSDSVFHVVSEVTIGLLPTFNTEILQDLAALSQKKVWGIVGVFALFWSITPFAGAIHDCVAHTFKRDKKESFLKRKLVDVSAVLALLILFVGLAIAKIYFSAFVVPLPGFLL